MAAESHNTRNIKVEFDWQENCVELIAARYSAVLDHFGLPPCYAA